VGGGGGSGIVGFRIKGEGLTEDALGYGVYSS